MKRFIFIIALIICLFGCNSKKHDSGIILWEYSPELNCDIITNSNYETLLKKYPKSIFIDFKDVKKYSKEKFTFVMKNQDWDEKYSSDLFCYWNVNGNSYFTVIINGSHYLTGISYLCYLSAQIPDIPVNQVILIPAKNGNLKFTNTVYDEDGYFGIRNNIDLEAVDNTAKFCGCNEVNTLDYNFEFLENYFKHRLKLGK
ncbi:MAG: hypothetical protein IK002_08620 [Treponema sp.]|uniref:hypothetical protein n=1 Tax=Treponema sp. TaxID=166 RepID=UPI00298E394E|nr:hypothetical protein [Treponema sp.]MBR5934032.1 hypothetical protein [Treponema sp.]